MDIELFTYPEGKTNYQIIDEDGNKNKWNLYAAIGWFINVLLFIF